VTKGRGSGRFGAHTTTAWSRSTSYATLGAPASLPAF